MIVIDDTHKKLEKDYGNLIRVPEWLGDLGDSELLLLMEYLNDLPDVENIRQMEKRGWQNLYK